MKPVCCVAIIQIVFGTSCRGTNNHEVLIRFRNGEVKRVTVEKRELDIGCLPNNENPELICAVNGVDEGALWDLVGEARAGRIVLESSDPQRSWRSFSQALQQQASIAALRSETLARVLKRIHSDWQEKRTAVIPAIVPVAAYLVKKDGGPAWCVVCVWGDVDEHGHCGYGHVCAWAFLEETACLVGFVSCE